MQDVPLTSWEDRQFATPLCAIELEEAILGGILLDPIALSRVDDVLPDPSAFYVSAHREIYRVMLEMAAKGKIIDLTSVFQTLKDKGLADKVGGQQKLIELLSTTIGTAAIDQYAEVVLEKYRRRQLRQIANDLMSIAADQERSLDELLDAAEQKLLSLSESSQKAGLRDLNSFLLEEISRIERIQAGELPAVLPTQYSDLDFMLQGGFRPGQLVIVAGRPGQGKSAFIGSMSRNIAKQGAKIALFSLEMDGGSVGRRLLAAESRIESGRLLLGRIADSEWEELGQAYSRLANLPIKIDDNQSVNPANVRSQCRRLKAQGGLDLIIVDYLHLMLDSGSDNEVRELGRITRSFKKLGRELDCPVVLLSQLSRKLEERSDKRPVNSDIRSSGNIEQDADIILFLYRDEYYNPETPKRGVVEVIIGKQREGPTGTVELLFESEFTNFLSMPKGG